MPIERNQSRQSPQAGRSGRSSSRSTSRSDSTRTSRRASSDAYGRARQAPHDTSRARYSQQASQAGERSRRTGGARTGTERQADRAASRRGASTQARQQRTAGSRRPPQRAQQTASRSSESILDKLPGFTVPLAGIVIIVLILLLIFAVIVPRCSGPSEAEQQATMQLQASQQTGLVHTVAQAKKEAQNQVESANQVGDLETSNTNVEALVSLLGEEETAKLITQAKTNPEALWIAAHPDEYAFDGIEVQYKILKLAADEPAAVSYVRYFPVKYPMADEDDDKSLAMDVASPSADVPTTKVPHLYQWDRRWAYTVYSSASFGLTGCGPTSLAMVYQGLKMTTDMSPHDMAVMAEEQGYMSEFNGTDGAFFTNTAEQLGLNCAEIYPDADNIISELRDGHVIIANLGAGYFTTNGHFFVLAGLTDDGKVIVNDPYSVVRSSQTWDADFIATESIAMFSYWV